MQSLKSIVFLNSHNINYRVIQLDEVPKTARDIERLYGCKLSQVLKSLVLITNKGPVIAILQGNKKLDFEKLKNLFEVTDIRMAGPLEVQAITGYSIGGVSPFGLDPAVRKVIDDSVFEQVQINIGSGDPSIGLELSSQDLKKVWDGKIASIS